MSAASAQLPHGAYTTFRTYGGSRVLRLGQHLLRLRESAALMGMSAGINGGMDETTVRHTLAKVLRQTCHA